MHLQGKPYNEKVDIFSFGVSAVEILTGSKRELHTDSGLTVDTRFPRDTPKLVQLLLHACLSIDPDQRPTADLVLLCLRASRSSGTDTLLLDMVTILVKSMTARLLAWCLVCCGLQLIESHCSCTQIAFAINPNQMRMVNVAYQCVCYF